MLLLPVSLLVLSYAPAQLITGMPTRAMRTRTSALRASGSAAAPAPYRSDANFDYFRSARTLDVTLPKPLGAVLEEVAPAGVRVEELQEGGSAMETGLLKKGDKFLSVLGEDVSSSSFDEVMALLMAAPDDKPVEITVRRVVITRKPRAAVAAPTITIQGGASGDVQQGDILRKALMEDMGVDLYPGMMDKMQQCGGVGQCSLCWCDIVEGGENLSPRTAVEEKKGAKKPPSYRMACQSIVKGDVTVALLGKNKK